MDTVALRSDRVAPGTGGAVGRRAPVPARVLPVAIGVLAFAVRLRLLLHGGGLLGIGGYDDGVDYAAGAALLHGRLPYADFLLLHPPGVALAVVPFAALGDITSDEVGLVVARLAFELIGGLNAALVVLVLRRSGTVAAATGGVLYAVLLPAVWAERSVLLEPLGTLGILLCLLLLGGAVSGRVALAAGIAAGSAIDVKIWYVVPVAVIAAFVPRHRLRHLAGAAIAVVAVQLPFLVAAPGAMIREVVLDQLGRPHVIGLLRRVAEMLDAHRVGVLDLRGVTAALAVLACVAVLITLLTPGVRVFGALLVADAAVLLASPSYFEHYGAFTAPPLALCTGIAVQRALRGLPVGHRPQGVLAAVVCALVLLSGLHVDDRRRSGKAVPVAFVQAVERTRGCITADDPTALAVTDVLSRDLRDPRCLVWPDVTGWTYDAADERTPSGHAVLRTENARWQRLLLDYLRSGSATMVLRRSTGLGARDRAALAAAPPIARFGHDVLRPVVRR
ncbi:hypothetical protein [uncultured Amnibacterium sp.]|uniref:hypothetical protein n=1 Tax=uncultured Amnibacterium sp. TaxID=1631851 RepID=UPI0035CC8C61